MKPYSLEEDEMNREKCEKLSALFSLCTLSQGKIQDEYKTCYEYSGLFYTACSVTETVDSGIMETAIP